MAASNILSADARFLDQRYKSETQASRESSAPKIKESGNKWSRGCSFCIFFIPRDLQYIS